MYERIDHVSISPYIASQEFTLVKVYSVKGFHDKAGFAPAAGKFHCRVSILRRTNISFTAISNLIETSLNVGLHMHASYRLTFKLIAASLFVHSACITKKHRPSLWFCRR